MMKITFLGGADEVGASGLLVELGGKRLLVDCGIRPSPKARWGLAGDQLPDLSLVERSGGLDAILVTHAHTDHTGALELVTGLFRDVPVYATPPTIALTRVLHQDARRIMQTRLDEEGELPLFDDVAVETLVSSFQPAPFHQPIPLGGGLIAVFYPAGHIAGAAMIGLASPEGRLLITGDVSISPQRTVDGARPPAFDPDVLIIESTYGGRLHANRLVQEKLLVKAVSGVAGGGGKVLIPVFALGRAQELLLILEEFRRRGELPDIPVWADGMVRAICQAYSSFPEVLPLALQERGARFFEGSIRPVESRDQRRALVWEPGPAVIVASSGMLAGGPAVEYARALASQPQHAILLTGYQDEESPGRRLQELAARGAGTMRLGKEKVEVQCHLGTYSLSAHADEAQLISLIETLNPSEVVLVHGDEPARLSLERALRERRRPVHLPHAGQALEFHFSGRTTQAVKPAAMQKRPVDLAALWQATGSPGGGFFGLEELARAWWGGPTTPEDLDRLQARLAQEVLYFAPDPLRPGVYRAHTLQQVELLRLRRQRMADLGDLTGQWLILRGAGGQLRLVRCTEVRPDRLLVALEDEPEQLAWPEEVITALGSEKPGPEVLAGNGMPAGPGAPVVMEPNQALAYTNGQFPPEARLRKTGYRLAERVLVLTFDFPDAARQRYAEQLAALQAATGWQVELIPEANQNALNSLAGTVLPPGWQIVKGPAIHRDQKRVAVTVSAPPAENPPVAVQAAQASFQASSGYELTVTLAVQGSAAERAVPQTPSAARWEVNAAYAAIREALAGSTLYRTSLKGDEIMLSFISPQVGDRFRPAIAALAQKVGWGLRINPQANAGAILEVARIVLEAQGWQAQKGPSLFPERAEVAVTLALDPEPQARRAAEEAVLERTGYRLVIIAASAERPAPLPAAPGLPAGEAVEIPLARIRLSRHHQSLALNPEKLAKTIERARRAGGIAPPIRVRRLSDSYLLLDGLYRLRAAEIMGLERVWVEVE